MAHNDCVRSRHLAVNTPVTFAGGNDTLRINALGQLYYANVSIGTPAVSFMVALDTGSDLFLLPCVYKDWASTQQVDVRAYYPNESSTNRVFSCLSSHCSSQQCAAGNLCAYEVHYMSNGTSSSGILVDDVLHLVAEGSDRRMDAPITFGCGLQQTGDLLHVGPRSGLLGLGMGDISIPCSLASQGITLNSFSMCFAQTGNGRIVFGDKGSSDEATPFIVDPRRPTYSICLTEIALDKHIAKINMTVVFDSGTSVTYLNDPAYSLIVDAFNSRIKQPRHTSGPKLPFEYCYVLNETNAAIEAPVLKFTMEGGSHFVVKKPYVIIETLVGHDVFCLGIIKSENIHIIGQNFMAGYRIVFDNEDLVLGWKSSDCNDPVDNGNETNYKNPTRARKGMAPKNLNSFTPKLLIFVFVTLWFILLV